MLKVHNPATNLRQVFENALNQVFFDNEAKWVEISVFYCNRYNDKPRRSRPPTKSTITPADCTGDKMFANPAGLVHYNHGPSNINPHMQRVEIIDPVHDSRGRLVGWQPSGLIYHVSGVKFAKWRCG